MPQDNLQNSGEREALGKYNPLYPGELGRALFHPEMDYNLDLIGQVIHGFRVMGTNSDGTINTEDDVEKVLKLYIVTSEDTVLIEAGAVIGDRVWIPATVSTEGGPAGPRGYQGYQGNQGRQGAQGAQGSQGRQGTTGAQGTQGPSAVGAPGDPGGAGPPGNQGPQGPRGPQGFQGNTGSVGNYGGDSLRFLVGNYNGSSAGSGGLTFSNITTLPSPSINIVVSNTDADGGNVSAWFASMIELGGSLRITKPGRTTEYLDYKITSGTTGTYSIISLEYVGGTVSVIGTSWPAGTELIISYAKTGPQGVQGSQGNQGNQGVQGVQGTQGFQGPQGAQGDQGYQGPFPWNLPATEYDNGISYGYSDAVIYLGGYYYRTGNFGNPGYPPTPGSINASWTPVADVGAQGYQGDLGPQGYQGDQGYQGVSYNPNELVIETAIDYELTNTDSGKIIIFTASATLTIPTGLIDGFECTFVTLAGATLTVDDTANTLENNEGFVMLPKLSFTLKRKLATDTFIATGNI